MLAASARCARWLPPRGGFCCRGVVGRIVGLGIREELTLECERCGSGATRRDENGRSGWQRWRCCGRSRRCTARSTSAGGPRFVRAVRCPDEDSSLRSQAAQIAPYPPDDPVDGPHPSTEGSAEYRRLRSNATAREAYGTAETTGADRDAPVLDPASTARVRLTRRGPKPWEHAARPVQPRPTRSAPRDARPLPRA